MSTYNGWSNWETWKTNLELVDGLTAEDVGIELYEVGEAYEAGQLLREFIQDQIFETLESGSFASSVLWGFFADVNWTEIARPMLEEHWSYVKESNDYEE